MQETYCSANGGWPLTFPAGSTITQSGSFRGALICLLTVGAGASVVLSQGSSGWGSGPSPCQPLQSLTLREEKKGQSFVAALSFCARLQLDPERGHQVELM